MDKTFLDINNYNYNNVQQRQQQQQQYPPSHQFQQPQPQQQQQSKLINFINNSGVEIYCDVPTLDENNVNNLLLPNGGNGFLACSYMKPPIDITISLPYPIDIERIGILSKVGTCTTKSLSFYVSEHSMVDLINYSNKTINTNNRQTLSQSSGVVFSNTSYNNNNNIHHPTTTTTTTTTSTTSHLSVNNHTDLSTERYPNKINNSNSNNNNNNNNNTHGVGTGQSIGVGFPIITGINQSHEEHASSSSSTSPFSTSPSSRSFLSQSLSGGNLINNNNNNINHINSNNNQQFKINQKNIISEQFKFLCSLNDLHLQNHYFKYICTTSFSNEILPIEISKKIVDPINQLTTFHSNKHYLQKVKSFRIRILNYSSCAALGSIEIWGQPSTINSKELIQFIYDDNLNNLKNGNNKIPSSQQYLQQHLLNNNNNNNKSKSLFSDTNWLLQSNTQQPQQQIKNNNNSFSIPNPFIKNDVIEIHDDEMNDDLDYISIDEGEEEDDDEDDEFKRDNPGMIFNEEGIPTIFIDPITSEIMTDPIILPSNNVVDRSTIQKHFQNQYFTDPCSGIPLSPSQIFKTDHALRQKIQSYKDHGKRKRLLKSNSLVFRDQLKSNMLPQISQNNITTTTTTTTNTAITSNTAIINNNNNNSRDNPICLDDEMSDEKSNNNRPTLLKIISQDSLSELPIKKHRR